MSNSESFASLFATPHTQPDDGDIQVFASAYLDAVQKEFENKLNAAQCSIFFQVASCPQSRKNAWSAEAGIAWKAARTDRLDLAALQLGLAYARLGAEGRVRGVFSERTRLFFEGYLLEAHGNTELVVMPEEITLHLEDGSKLVRWKRQGQQWRPNTVSSADGHPFLNWSPVLESDDSQTSYVIQPGYSVTSDGYKLPDDMETLPYGMGSIAGDVNEIRMAQQYLTRFASSYTGWVRNVSSGFLLCDNFNSDGTMSCSSLQLPGLILVGKGASAAQCGELLVHEASHQYLNIYGLLGGLVNGQDTELYYSPLKRSARPLDRVLYAAHAAVNMLLYYAETVKNGASSEDTEGHAAYLLETVEHTRAPLANSNGLTASGRAVYEATIAQLDSQDFTWVRNRRLVLA